LARAAQAPFAGLALENVNGYNGPKPTRGIDIGRFAWNVRAETAVAHPPELQ
jgi:hypothetical protein